MFTKNLQSDVISFLRFPLIIGVVFIHNTSTTVAMPNTQFGVSENLPIFNACSALFSGILGRVAVPLFFFISGFLFFRNIDGLTKHDYLKKMRSRGKTLLVPYLFWNIAVLLVYYIARHIPALTEWFSEQREYNWQYILTAMWGIRTEDGTMTSPIAYQFWFIRDLMVTVILTPVIYFYIKKTKIYGVLLLSVLWFFGWWFRVAGFSIVAIFFFTVGAWFGINKRNIVDDMGIVRRWSFVLYPLLAIVDFSTQDYDIHPFIHNAGIIVGIMFWINLVAYLLRTEKMSVNRFLSASSFFLFAIHDPLLLSKIRKILYVIFNPQSDLVVTSLYFILVFVVVFIALGAYYLLKRYIPKFTAIITGGR
jgi:fucose 4-O-acetylase-like acetyltransferase